MVLINFILVYILIGILFTSIFAWDEIRNVFSRSEKDSQNPLTKEEWQEFWTLIAFYTFGWSLLLVLIVEESVKGIWKK